MDDLNIGRIGRAASSSNKPDFSEVDPALFGEEFAKQLGISAEAPSLGNNARVAETARPIETSRVEPRPQITELKSNFSDKEMHHLFSLVNDGFVAAGL